jgi:type VI secretion system FHA domain protein
MALILKVISYRGLPPVQEITARFDVQGGSIGRSPDNNLVLPDPEKFISRLHAAIVYKNDQYFIEDSSTGGTYLELKGLLLQQIQMPLMNGERLRIGEYTLEATIVDNAVSPFGFTPVEEPVRPLDWADSGMLDALDSKSDQPASAPDFFSSFIDQPESSVFHQSFNPPQIASTPQVPELDDLDFGDLLSGLDSLPNSSKHQQPELPTLPDDFFAEETIRVDSPIESEVVSNFDDLFGDPFVQSEPKVAKPLADSVITPFDMPSPNADLSSVNLEVENAATDIHLNSIDPLQPGIIQVLSVNDDSVSTDDIAVAKPDKPQPEQGIAAATESELLKHFLAGAGINDPGFLPAEQWPMLMKTSGELLRSMVEGLMLVLRARAELKSQFRVSVTTMRSVDNNPLKFTPNVDDAMKLMLAPTNPGFLPPKEAVNGGFRDIMNHQMAMTAGIQAALGEILHGFDPELIEKSQGEGLLFQKKAKCWEVYANKYPQLKAAAQEDFFGDAFAEAYEKQMLLLSRTAKSQ